MLIISKIDGSVFSQISRNQARLIQFPRGYLRTFARQRVLQPGVSRLTVARGHPLNGGTSLVLADIASTRVAHDARVDPHRRLSRPSVKRRPSNRPTGPRSCRWRIWLCNREPIRINSGEQRIKQWKISKFEGQIYGGFLKLSAFNIEINILKTRHNTRRQPSGYIWYLT